MEQRKPAEGGIREQPDEQVLGDGRHLLGFDSALLSDGWRNKVVVLVNSGGVIERLWTGVQEDQLSELGGDGVHWTHGPAVPGMANVHSHAHQRLMVGLAERSGPGDDTFWTWREAMYRFASRLSPEQLEVVAAQAYVEMLEAGFTAVGEFQYLHNQVDGHPYDQAAEMSLRCLEAARRAGIGITLLPVLYSRGGFDGRPLAGGQERFANDVEAVMEMVSSIESVIASDQVDGGVLGRSDLAPTECVGVAPHSLRAVAEQELVELVAATSGRDSGIPIHLHVSEQRAEVKDCVQHTGRRPVRWLLERMGRAGHAVDERWCLIHATHLDASEVQGLAASGAVVGLCPTTEANLGDGTFEAEAYLIQGQGRVAIGTDSQVRISVAEDLRQLETSQRLRDSARNVLAGGPKTSTGRELFGRCVIGGAQALGQRIGAIKVGLRADLVVLDASHPRLVERTEDALLDSWIFAGDNSCVSKVYVGGHCVVSGGRHTRSEQTLRRFKRVLRQLADVSD